MRQTLGKVALEALRDAEKALEAAERDGTPEAWAQAVTVVSDIVKHKLTPSLSGQRRAAMRTLRAAGWSLAELQELTGLTQSRISQIMVE